MSKSNPILKSLFSSDTRIKVLSHFYLHPGESYYIRQLEKILKIPVGQLRRELINLENIQLLTSSLHGNQKWYSLNQDFPLYDELKKIFLKTTSVGDIIRESLAKIKGIELVFIYGSFAKGEEHLGSDIDIMIVGSTSDKEIARAISDGEKKLKRALNYSLYERKEIKARLKKRDNFIFTVFHEPRIILIGNKNDELFRFY
jgi:predicted nucleotidyltransferase